MGAQNVHKKSILENFRLGAKNVHKPPPPSFTTDAAKKFLVIQQHAQTVQFVNKQNETSRDERIFLLHGTVKNEKIGNDNLSTGIHVKVKECTKCGNGHEPKSKTLQKVQKAKQIDKMSEYFRLFVFC